MAEIALDGRHQALPRRLRGRQDMNLEIEDGEFMILVGPSGCGKSTALRMIAGLEDITDGELRIGGEVVNDKAPKDRDIAMVFQNYALYPHMTRARQHGLRAQAARASTRRRSTRRSRRRRASSTSSSTSTASPAQPLRRPAPARGDGPRDRARPAGVPDGRAALEPRREAARADAHRGVAHPEPPRHHDGLRDPRPDRGDDARRPRGGHARRRACSRSARRWSSTTTRATCSWRGSSARRR